MEGIRGLIESAEFNKLEQKLPEENKDILEL